MTQKHTPGAWYISYAHKMRNGHYAAGTEHKILPEKYDGKKGLPIASILAASENAEANARLIAAAVNSYDKHCGANAVKCAEEDLLGELLEALDYFYQFAVLNDDGEDEKFTRMLEKACAAIAEATGSAA